MEYEFPNRNLDLCAKCLLFLIVLNQNVLLIELAQQLCIPSTERIPNVLIKLLINSWEIFCFLRSRKFSDKRQCIKGERPINRLDAIYPTRL